VVTLKWEGTSRERKGELNLGGRGESKFCDGNRGEKKLSKERERQKSKILGNR